MVGDKDIQPYAVMILFISLAYVCISLDATGLLASIALRAVQISGSSRKRLFIYFYMLAAAMSTVTSNDIVILTLTPMVTYCVQHTGSSPWPFLFAMFTAANICSLFFVIGNPTNIIVAEAFGISFGEYFKNMVVPAFVTALSGGVVLYIIFRNQVSGSFEPPQLDPQGAIIDSRGAVVHAFTLVVCLIFMAISSFLPFHVRLWMVALGAAIVSGAYNVYAYPWFDATNTHMAVDGLKRIEGSSSPDSLDEDNHVAEEEYGGYSATYANSNLFDRTEETYDEENAVNRSRMPIYTPSTLRDSKDVNVITVSDPTITIEDISSINRESSEVEKNIVESEQSVQKKSIPSVFGVLMSLPWSLMPFVFGMFTIVQALVISGWVTKMAEVLISMMGGIDATNGRSWQALVPSLVMMGVSLIACNVMNNQPAAILLTRILTSAPFRALDDKALRGSLYSVIGATNIAAVFTLIGSLAGIMFANILALHGLKMTYMRFFKVGVILSPAIALFCALFVAIFLK